MIKFSSILVHVFLLEILSLTFFSDSASRKGSAAGGRGGSASGQRKTINFDEADEPYQVSNRQEVGQFY